MTIWNAFVWVSAGLGFGLSAWLIAQVVRDYRWHAKQLRQARKYQNHHWMSEQHTQNLKDAAMWKGYRKG